MLHRANRVGDINSSVISIKDFYISYLINWGGGNVALLISDAVIKNPTTVC